MRVRIVIEYEYEGDAESEQAAQKEELAQWFEGHVSAEDIISLAEQGDTDCKFVLTVE